MNRLRKEVNRLLSKGMSSIYLKITVEMFSKLQFSESLKFVTSSVLGSSNLPRYHWILKLLVATEKSKVWQQNCDWLFYFLNFEWNHDVLTSKSPCILLIKNINFNKTKRNRKWKIPRTVLERQTLCLFCTKESFLTFVFYLNA